MNEFRDIVIRIDYSAFRNVKEKKRGIDYEYQTPMTKEDNLVMLKTFGAKLLSWLESVKEDCGVEEYGEIEYDVGNEGIGDAYVGGGYQAVDIDCPSAVSIPVKANEKNINKLIKKIVKMLPEWEGTVDPELSFYYQFYQTRYTESVYLEDERY